MKVEPVGNHVVIKRLDGEKKTSGGILLPDSAQEKPHQGRVLSVGDGRRPTEVLLDQQDREALLLEHSDGLTDLLDDNRR